MKFLIEIVSQRQNLFLIKDTIYDFNTMTHPSLYNKAT